MGLRCCRTVDWRPQEGAERGSKLTGQSLADLAAGLLLGGDCGPGRPVAGLPRNLLSGYWNWRGAVSSGDLFSAWDRAAKVFRYMREKRERWAAREFEAFGGIGDSFEGSAGSW